MVCFCTCHVVDGFLFSKLILNLWPTSSPAVSGVTGDFQAVVEFRTGRCDHRHTHTPVNAVRKPRDSTGSETQLEPNCYLALS